MKKFLLITLLIFLNCSDKSLPVEVETNPLLGTWRISKGEFGYRGDYFMFHDPPFEGRPTWRGHLTFTQYTMKIYIEIDNDDFIVHVSGIIQYTGPGRFNETMGYIRTPTLLILKFPALEPEQAWRYNLVEGTGESFLSLAPNQGTSIDGLGIRSISAIK